MVFEPLADTARWFRAWLPTEVKFGKPSFNFITAHYMYMIGLSILGSIIVYPKNMSYINALFFAAGSATQSGLNPVNVNEIHLYQQVVLMLIACIANPIFINTIVVFVRLYWFEKRFETLVKEIRTQQRSRTRSFNKTFSKARTGGRENSDLNRLEMGVNGRNIRVLHDTTKPNGMTGSTARTAEAEKEFAEKQGLEPVSQSVSSTTPGGSNASDEVAPHEQTALEGEKQPETPQSPWLGHNPRLHREITFADEVPTPSSAHAQQAPQLEQVPEGRDLDRHIYFMQRQQANAKQELGTLRIPGPRDFDRGELPTALDDADDNELNRPQTRNTVGTYSYRGRSGRRGSDGPTEELNGDDHPVRRGITIDEPQHPGHHKRDSGDEERGNTTSSHNPLHRIKSTISRRSRTRGFNLSDAKGSMAKTFSTMRTTGSTRVEDSMPYLSWQATTGRNSAFLGLSATQREELGGIEYRSLKTLAKVLILYFVGFHLLGMVILLPWILHTQPWKAYVQSVGVSPTWWGIFTPASMFNDLGFTLTPDSMNSFETGVLPLLFGSFLIIIGNTGFPCMLRFVIWVASKLVPVGSATWEELRFLLDHPRRCFTLLFPSKATWWLFWILVLLNGIDLVFFIILDLNDETVTSLAPGFRVLDGWFQAASTRTAGFSCVNLADLHPAIQVSYLIMMYISVFPIAISVRRTNVYEEKSLGIWGGEEAAEEDEPSYVGQHLRRQLSFDLWYIFLGFFVICIVEGGRLSNTNEFAFTMFSVLFEIVSAYGTVGLSLGYPTIDASFSAEFRIISKLVIIAMMLRGRHRGLPYALDRAILLPSENLHKKEAEEADRRHARRSSVFDREGAWQDGDLDVTGLPKQRTGDDIIDPMSAGAGSDQSPELRRLVRRRSSAITTASGEGKRKHERSRSIGVVIAGGLSAGPTFNKHE